MCRLLAYFIAIHWLTIPFLFDFIYMFRTMHGHRGADQTIPNIWHNTIESSEINRPRSKRGKVPRASNLRIKSDVKQHLDANDNDAMPMEDIQTNFLSESVRKYLELGRAIPGKRIDKFKTF